MKMSWTIAGRFRGCPRRVEVAAEAAGIDLPARKPGQWEIKMTPKTAGAAPTMTTQLCLDAASDKALMQQGLAMSPGCTTQQSRDGSGNMVFDATCDIGGRKTKAHSRHQRRFPVALRRSTSSPTAKAAVPACPSTRKCSRRRPGSAPARPA